MSDVETRGFNPVTFLRNAMRNSPWIVMAVALHLILAAFALIFYANKQPPTKIDDTAQISMTQHKVEDEVVIPPEIIDRKAIPKNEEAELVPYELDVYTPSTEQEDLHMEHGDPNAADNAPPGATGGTAIGVGNSGHAGSGRPSPFSSRKLGGGGGKGRGGATQGTDKAVLDGLRWLCRHQNEDGSWSPTTLNDRCPCDDPMYNPKSAYSKNYDEGLTGMALLCFLGAGFSHESKQDIVDTAMGKRYKVGTVVKNGLQWLVKRQSAEGSFGNGNPFMYNEALAGMAVAEAYGLTQNRFWKEPAQKSMNFIMGAQRPNPAGQGLWGWRYDSRQTIESGARGGSMDEATKQQLFDSDTSVTGWCIMALKSGRLSGLDIKDENMAGGAAFARHVTADNGMVGYLDSKTAGATVQGKNDFYTYHPATMSSLGMCIRIFSEHNPDDPFLDLAAKQVVKDLPAVSKESPPLSVDYYYWYYGSLALNQIDGPDAPKKTGKYWGPWNKAMVDAVLGLQDHKERACTNGGWMVPDRWAYDGGPIYTTALNVLTLEVYYRYENAFGGSKRN
jgi:hypothetical protein